MGRLLKIVKKILHRLTLDYEAAILTCIEKGIPLTKKNIYDTMEHSDAGSK